ncbi:hypothetical protein FD723_40785 (plasmid) [Nostoc sp. C052]|uniref:hypothetical protein n=1 Tax=Nostoc sp. C052 TaxID=2576902 RepID=UPI0015C2EBAA|nr:hypothetical protein [Nostoc sp. C052]QLE46552.1 hypothetical protein FD723_40785 [Nostoc sp. C052]
MNIYRCTRQRPYTIGTPGFTNPKHRDGYYQEADSHEEALSLMQAQFPDEKVFSVQLWTSDKNASTDVYYMEDGILYLTATGEVASIK